ncbi:MAG: nucleotidyl transferase AbiEii/AbiGii toxin family protein [Spirochaeta sp.]|nr:nucleotidyl transferase AbiEii/AbiGii toxin family protein [Spirochaeta sp.]
MKEQLRELSETGKTVNEATLLVREYLQARILEALQRAGAFKHWAFLGGTALRFLFRLPRFSEDLDFSLAGVPGSPDIARDEFTRFIAHITKTFEAEAYAVETRERPEGTVQCAFIGFPGLLYELGLSPHPEQRISIKIEVDTNPPEGTETATSVVRRHVFLNLFHYDKTSLFAGKLHAIVQCPYAKGRDIYDLVWYLSDSTWPEPNLRLLHAALAQTGTTLSEPQISGWRNLVAQRLAGYEPSEWNRIIDDVRPFLENSEEIELLRKDTLLGLLH